MEEDLTWLWNFVYLWNWSLNTCYLLQHRFKWHFLKKGTVFSSYLLAGIPDSLGLQMGFGCQRSLCLWTRTTFCLMFCGVSAAEGKMTKIKQEKTIYFHFHTANFKMNSLTALTVSEEGKYGLYCVLGFKPLADGIAGGWLVMEV